MEAGAPAVCRILDDTALETVSLGTNDDDVRWSLLPTFLAPSPCLCIITLYVLTQQIPKFTSLSPKSKLTFVIKKIRNTVHTAGIYSFSMYRLLTRPFDGIPKQTQRQDFKAFI